jgi:hypothetical protein
LESTGEKVNGTVIFNVYYGGDLPWIIKRLV